MGNSTQRGKNPRTCPGGEGGAENRNVAKGGLQESKLYQIKDYIH